jgi:hypothetical protein
MELNSEFINNLPYTDERIINKYIKLISKELVTISNNLKEKGDKNYHNNAREQINKKYGKFWRDNLISKKSQKL